MQVFEIGKEGSVAVLRYDSLQPARRHRAGAYLHDTGDPQPAKTAPVLSPENCKIHLLTIMRNCTSRFSLLQRAQRGARSRFVFEQTRLQDA